MEWTPDEMKRQQQALAAQVLTEHPSDPGIPHPGQIIATLDVQYLDTTAFVAIDLHEFPDRHIKTYLTQEAVRAEYQPGFFAFREGPVLRSALQRMALDQIDCLVVDGHGRAHPRLFGVASWLGLEMNKPCIGLAKESLLPFQDDLGSEQGSCLEIKCQGQVVGMALRTVTGVKPVFVSVGHLINLDRAVQAVLAMGGPYRVIEPMRRADQACRAAARGESIAGAVWLTDKIE